MNPFKINKIIVIIPLILILIITFLIFSNIRNAFIPSTDSSINSNITYLYLIFLVLLGILQFVISINLINQRGFDNQSIENKIETVIEKAKEEKQDSENEGAALKTINVNEYIKKIIPKENTKTKIDTFTENVLINISKEFEIVQGLFFIKDPKTNLFKSFGKYAYFPDEEPKEFKTGESLPGQVAKNKTILNISNIPENYINIFSGLGKSSPKYMLFIPILYNNKTIGVIELASFKSFNKNTEQIFTELSGIMGEKINTLLKINKS